MASVPTIGIVILSRFNSSRLPGKALMRINDKPLLAYIIERLSTVVANDKIVLATSDQPSDDAIADFAKQNGTQFFRGDIDNVAQRFYEAGTSRGWDYIMRINGDNLFVDTGVLADMIKVAERDEFDFVSNVKNRTFPKGMSIEIVKASYYKALSEEIYNSDFHREHVTSFLYESEDRGKHYYYMNETIPEAAGIQMAIDTPDDFEMAKEVINSLTGDHTRYNLADIYPILKRLQYA